MPPRLLDRLPSFPVAVSGVAGGAIAMLALPSALANALGLVAAGGWLLGAAALERRRLAAEREQTMAAIGEIKVRMATNAIKVDRLAMRIDQLPMGEQDAAPARATLGELTAEVGLLGELLQQMADTLADHETRLVRGDVPEFDERFPEPMPAIAARPEPVLRAVELPPPPPPEPDPREIERQRAAERERDARAQLVGEALAAGRVEIHLQPIVQLPQRRTRGYEAFVRLRCADGRLLDTEDFVELIEERGFGPTLDALVLVRVLAVARHLASKAGDLYVSCNFSETTWRSSRGLAALSRILDRYADHAGRLVIEMPQAVFRTMEPTSLGMVGAMSARGVRFALDRLTDLRLDAHGLAERGIRFVKAPASLLVEEAFGKPKTDIEVYDLSALLERSSIILVADGVEDDPTAADMIDLGIGHAQGTLFSPPRPVRAEIFAEALSDAPAEPRPQGPGAEIVAYPATAAAQAEPAPETSERVSFRSVLRRASA